MKNLLSLLFLGINFLAYSQVEILLKINQPPELRFEVSRQDTAILAGKSVMLAGDLLVSGGSPPYQYSWFPAAHLSDPSVAHPSANPPDSVTYILTVTDQQGCKFSLPFAVNVIPELQVSAVIADAGCKGGSNGSIKLTVVQGSPPYQFVWSIGQITSNLTNLKAGNYTVIVTDSSGQSLTKDFEIKDYDEIVTQIDTSVCAGEEYSVGSKKYTLSGNYADTLVSVAGCDSIIRLKLTVNPVFENTVTASVCQGKTYTFEGTAYSVQGNYTARLKSIHGCDSLRHLVLTVYPAYSSTIEASICQGEVYTYRSTPYIQTGKYPYNLTSVSGCDSLVVLDLIVHPLPEKPFITVKADTLTSSSPANLWYLNGVQLGTAAGQKLVIGKSGNYQVVVVNAQGCRISSDVVQVVYSFEEILEQNELVFKLFPNPNDGEFNIRITGLPREKIELITADVTGRILDKRVIKHFSGDHMEVLRLPLVAGIYTLRLVADSEILNSQFIVK